MEILLWIGGPAIVIPAAVGNGESWAGLVFLLILWWPAIVFALRPAGRSRADVVMPVVTAVLALAVQAAGTQFVVADTVSEATADQVYVPPRTIYGLAGDLFPLPAGATLDLCVQRRPGGGYIGD